jgi:predicted nucleic acid-binding protein
MAAKYLLDSDICIKSIRRRDESLSRMVRAIRPEGLAISVITFGEVLEGVLCSRERALNALRWRDFVASVDVLDVTLSVAEVWAEVRGSLRSIGKLIPDNDLLIASTALRFGMTVVTGNLRHFVRVPGLDVLVPGA